MVFLFFFLHLNPTVHTKTFRQYVAEFDFFGLFLIIAGIVCFLIGFSESSTSCECLCLWLCSPVTTFETGTSPPTITLLVVGFVLLVAAGFWEGYTSRSPIIPPRLFKVSFDPKVIQTKLIVYSQTRTTGIILVTVFLHAMMFIQSMIHHC